MNVKKSNSKYRLLVLMDLTKASETALKNAVQLAKVINGSVEAFHVKAPTHVVEYENQYSAVRAIHADYRSTKLRLGQMISTIEKEEGIPVTYQIAYGNVKNTIRQQLAKIQPDIVLLGKRKSKWIEMGQGITRFVLKHCSANILIAGGDHKFHSYNNISMGVYGEEALQQKGFEVINDIKQQGTCPIRFFSIRNRKKSQKDTATTLRDGQGGISYVFSEGSNALDGLASYVSRTNTQLFCISRKFSNRRSLFPWNKVEAPVRQVIQKLDIPVLVLR